MAPPTNTALELYGPLVMHVIWRLVPDRDDASDIYQDTFLEYHRAQTEQRTISHPKAWLCRTARNRAFDHLQAKRKQSRTDPENMGEMAEEAQSEHQTAHLMINRLRELVADLPDQQRQAFGMRHFEDLAFAEIASQLGCSADAARASTHKAMKKIRALLNFDGRHFHV